MAEVEILLAAYNGEKYIGEQIDSILAQQDTRWHLTISDDGSTDETAAIIDAYVARFPGKIARYRSGRRFGHARDHFFHLMRHCGAAYMMFCDQDDVWYPQKVGKTLEAMQAAERVHGQDMPLLVFADQTPTDERLCPLAPSLMRYQKQYFEEFDYRSLLMQNVVTGGAMMINRALANLGGQCVDSSGVIMHDWWLAVVAARFGKILYIDEPLSDYRQHGNNSVGAKDVGSMGYVWYMFTNMRNVRKALLCKKVQARIYTETYRMQLSVQDRTFLQQFSKARSGLLFYWKNRKWIHGSYRLAGMILLG